VKLFISADIEGTAGILSFNEAEKTHADYAEFRALMTQEVIAACEGACAAGATEILIRDAHDTASNLLLEQLPAVARIVRGWSGHPDAMMFGLDASFAGAIYTGYHAKAGSEANPLAHSFNLRISRLLLNGVPVSEFTINALCAARYGVPSLFLAGDCEICADATALIPTITTVETLYGAGRAALSLSPAACREQIRSSVGMAVRGRSAAVIPEIPGHLELVIEFNNPCDAYRAAWYPKAVAHGPRAVCFEDTDLFEIMRALRFMTS